MTSNTKENFDKIYFGAHVCYTSYITKLRPLKKYINYMIYGKEICPTTGRPHFQGYVFLKRRDFKGSKIQEIIGDPNCQIKKCDGSPLQNFNYCSKDNNYVEIGKRPFKDKEQSNKDKVKNILIKTLKKEDLFEDYILYIYDNNIKDDILYSEKTATTLLQASVNERSLVLYRPLIIYKP